GVATQQRADDVPDLGVPLAAAEDGIDAFGERAETEREHAQGPPQQVWRALGEIMRDDPAQKEHREDRRQDWYVIDHGGRRLNLKDVGRFLHSGCCAINAMNCSEIGPDHHKDVVAVPRPRRWLESVTRVAPRGAIAHALEQVKGRAVAAASSTAAPGAGEI